MLDLTKLSLDDLPAAETADLEYKSSLTPTDKLKEKLHIAASAFWNSGGGVFIAGVDNAGKVDGGIPRKIGRQPLEDWFPQHLHAVKPAGRYSHRVFEPGEHAGVSPDRCVLAVRFEPSVRPPHQAPDHRHYIRSGPMSVPAEQFVVDALYALRHHETPVLSHWASWRHYTTDEERWEIEIVTLTDAPALNVDAMLTPGPTPWRGIPSSAITVHSPFLDRSHPLHIHLGSVILKEPYRPTLTVTYLDLLGRSHKYETLIDRAKMQYDLSSRRGTLALLGEEIRDLRAAIERGGFGGAGLVGR